MVNNAVNLHCKIPVFWSIAIIPAYLVFQMYENPPGVQFLKALSKFRKRKKSLSLLVYDLHKREIRGFKILRRDDNGSVA